ncbi:MAG: hypothetical protein AAF657_03810 [Acidobacteriota bacterium]
MQSGSESEPIERKAPRAFNRDMYHDRINVFYGTDDGAQDGSFSEFREFEEHYHGVAPERRDDIHMVSVVGGLYGLNLMPLWKPKRITIFDINPTAVSYFKVIRRVFQISADADEFLDHLTHASYDVADEEEEFVRENIRLRRANQLPRSRGSSKRSYEESWTYALKHFALTKSLLTDIPLNIRCEPMEAESFNSWIKNQNNLWIYASNITQFHFFDLEFDDPSNVVLLQIIFPEQPQLLDLAPLAPSPAKVRVEIPMVAERLDT